MKMSRVLLASLFVTAVILVVVGSVVASTLARQNASARDAEYNQIITQANEQLEKANAELQAMQARLTQTLPVSIPAAPEAAQSLNLAVSAEKAVEIASLAVDPGTPKVTGPDLVDFQGKTAYEVGFESGSVYVDAASGEVLFNGTQPVTIDAKQAAQVAAEYLRDSNILQVDQITFRGQKLFRVIFKSGTMAYLDEHGQITYINKGVIALGGDDGGGGGGGSSSEHHSDDDHEEHDDD